jgi:hypothetical protein
MDRMEAVENWELFEDIRQVGIKKAAAAGIISAHQRREGMRTSLNRKKAQPRS